MMETQKKEIKEKIETKDLVSELAPILKDYFVANVQQEETGIKVSFPGGQKFYITIKEN